MRSSHVRLTRKRHMELPSALITVHHGEDNGPRLWRMENRANHHGGRPGRVGPVRSSVNIDDHAQRLRPFKDMTEALWGTWCVGAAKKRNDRLSAHAGAIQRLGLSGDATRS